MLNRDTLIKDGRKPIRSFIARQGRKSSTYDQAIADLWPKYGLQLDNVLEQRAVFGRVAPLIVEIGFGNGQSLLELAAKMPDHDFIGIEVYKKGIEQLLRGVEMNALNNVRIYCADAVEVLKNCIHNTSLQGVQLFFPDPWPKARHHKRRIVQPDFVNLLHMKLVDAGTFHMATDWQNYAEQMLIVMEEADGWENLAGFRKYSERPKTRIVTKFESRGYRLGHGSWDIIFRKCLLSNIL